MSLYVAMFTRENKLFISLHFMAHVEQMVVVYLHKQDIEQKVVV